MMNEHDVGEALRRIGRVLLVAGCTLAALVSGCSSGEGEGESESSRVRFVEPTVDQVVSGVAPIEVELVDPTSSAQVSFQIDDNEPVRMHGLRERWTWNTLIWDNGSYDLTVELSDESGSWSDTVRVEVDNAAHQLDHYRANRPWYANEELVVVELRYAIEGLDLEADFGALDSEFEPANVDVVDLGDGNYEIHYTISPENDVADGKHRVVVSAVDERGVEVRSGIRLELKNEPEIPFEVAGGSFVAGPVPEASDEPGGASVEIVRADRIVLSGGTAELELSWQEDADRPGRAIVVAAEGYTGRYVIPLADLDDAETTANAVIAPKSAAPEADDDSEVSNAEGGTHTLRLSNFSFSRSSEVENVTLLIGIIDALGIVEWIEESLEFISVLTGGVQISLAWDTDADLDLHVVEPGGSVVDWENPEILGGVLDLDSNSLCEIDGTNAENVAWLNATEPQGQYEVRVNMYDACGTEEVNWTVTVIACGETHRFEGSLTPEDATPGEIGEIVATFNVDCLQRISGVLEGERDEQGEAAASSVTFKQLIGELDPVSPPRAGTGVLPHIPIFALAVDDPSTPLAQTFTRRDGTYELRFALPAGEKYVIEARAQVIEPARKVIVGQLIDSSTIFMGSRGDGFAKRSAEFTSTGGVQVVDSPQLKILKTEHSGAFYIASRMSEAVEWFRANVHQGVPAFGVTWNTKTGTSSYNECADTILIDVGDEFDDSVIAHEFMHHVLSTRAGIFNDNFADRDQRVEPSQALDEGLATFFGQASLGDPLYLDFDPVSGTYSHIDDLEADPNPFYGGVDSSGRLNELLVGMALWDLIDGPSSSGSTPESHDKIDNRLPLVIQAVFDRVDRLMAQRRAMFPDRTANPGCGDDITSRPEKPAELIDVIDAYRCEARSRSISNDAEVEAILHERQFPFDPNDPALMCQ